MAQEGSAVVSGQLTLDGNAQQLITTSDYADVTRTVVIKAHAANTDPLYAGNSDVTTATGLEVAPGDYIAIDIANPNSLYVEGTAADEVSWLVLKP